MSISCNFKDITLFTYFQMVYHHMYMQYEIKNDMKTVFKVSYIIKQ